jgi:tetratricopeptide (TPR) repeat protein
LRLDGFSGGLAGAELRHFLDLNADQPTGQLQKAGFAYARGNLAAAEAHLRKAVVWDPGSAAFRHELAIVLSALGQPRGAIEQLEAARALAPREAEYAFKLALAFAETGESARVRALLEEAVGLEPRHARAWYNLGLARSAAGDAVGAIEALRRAESLQPGEAEFPYARATIHARQAEYDAARAVPRIYSGSR